MKVLFIFLTSLLVMNSVNAQSTYDSVLAKKLKADARGMRMYVLVILKSGEKKYTDKAVQDSLFKGHMDNIKRLADAGMLSVAGPLEKNDKNYRGIFVFNVNTIDEAKKLVDTDPAVKAGIFAYDAFEWYCTAALQQIPAIHKTIEKK